jgi:hypothetical protein
LHFADVADVYHTREEWLYRISETGVKRLE